MSTKGLDKDKIKRLLKQLYFSDLTFEHSNFCLKLNHKDSKFIKYLKLSEPYYRKYFLILDIENNSFKRKVPYPEKYAVEYFLKQLNQHDAPIENHT